MLKNKDILHKSLSRFMDKRKKTQPLNSQIMKTTQEEKKLLHELSDYNVINIRDACMCCPFENSDCVYCRTCPYDD